MANQPSRRTAQTEAKLALLQSILDPEPAYPWEHRLTEADEQLAKGTLEFTAAEADQGWNALSQQLDAFWNAAGSADTLAAALLQKFANRLSVSVIGQIAQTAQQVASSGRPLAEQLIACVQDTLSDWDEADLQVMARPLAYSMRGQEEQVDAAIAAVRDTDWKALSAVEQARLSLAAARYALDYLAQ